LQPTSSSAVSCCMSCRAASTASGTTASSLAYGLLAGSSRKANLVHARELLNITVTMDGDIADEPEGFRPPCPCCGGRMIVIEMFKRWRQPRGPPNSSAPNRENVP